MKSSKKTMLVAAVTLLLAAALFVGAAGADAGVTGGGCVCGNCHLYSGCIQQQ